MSHFFYLVFMLAVLIIYSNLFTCGYLILLHKHKNNFENIFKLFLAFALSISSIFLLLIFPEFAFNDYAISLSFLGIAFLLNLVYIFKNRKYLKTISQDVIEVLKENKILILILFAAIFLSAIPALHYNWYFGYGVDWNNHVGLIKNNIIGTLDTFYPAINVHAFLSILQLLDFSYPEIFQISTAYLINISILPFFFIAKSILDKRGLTIALLLWPIIPYHHFMYGEYIPNASSIFFYLSFFLIIFKLLKNQLAEKQQKDGLLVVAGGLFLTVAIYNHQTFLYPFFYIFALLTIFFIFFLKQYKKIPWLLFMYSKILILTFLLTVPFLGKLYSGANDVLALHKTDPIPYDFGSFLNSVINNLGIIVFTAGLIGAVLYIKRHYQKSQQKEQKLNAAVMVVLLLGTLLAVNIYFDQNPFWSQRSFYLLEIFFILPLAHLVSFIMENHPWKIIKIGFLLLFVIITSAKIDYALAIDAMWSEEIQSSVTWVKENKKTLQGKEIYIVFNEIGGATNVFFLAINTVAQTPVKQLSKVEFAARPEATQDTEVLNNNFYRIVQNGNKIYIDYKVEVLYSYDALNFQTLVNTRPERSYVLDKIIKRHFFVRKTDQQSLRISGYGLPIGNGIKAGQKFLPTADYLYNICVNLSKSQDKSDPIDLILYEEGKKEPVKISSISTKKAKQIPINTYTEYCFPIRKKIVPLQAYIFYVTSAATEQYYAVLNAGAQAYPYGSAYDSGGAVADNLLFRTETFYPFIW